MSLLLNGSSLLSYRSLEDKKARKCPHCDKTYVSMPAFSTLAPLDWLLMPGSAIPRICLAPDLLPAVLAVLLLDRLTLSASREEPPDMTIKLVLEADPSYYNHNHEGSIFLSTYHYQMEHTALNQPQPTYQCPEILPNFSCPALAP